MCKSDSDESEDSRSKTEDNTINRKESVHDKLTSQ